MSQRFRLLGLDESVNVCDLCGKADLKCTMVLAELDADGSDVGEVYYGRDCGARALGWSVSADRAEKLVRGTARIAEADLQAIWHRETSKAWGEKPLPRFPEGAVDGVRILVWNRFYNPWDRWPPKDLALWNKAGKKYAWCLAD